MYNNETSEFSIFNNYRNLNITSITHVNDTYIVNLLEKSPKITFIQSFLMTFITLLGDETFILLILLKQQFSKSHLIFYAFLTSLLFLNTINVLFGRSLDILLYQNFIDVFAIIIFCIISVRHFLKFFDKKKRLKYLKEIELIIKPELIIEEEEEDGDINRVHDLILKKSCVNVNDYDSRNKNNEIEYNEDYIYQRYYEGHNKGFLFWIFAKTIFISVFGDSYMLAIISNSAISNFKGTLYGSSLGILIIVYLACHHGMFIGSHLSEGKMGVVISFLYFGLAAEIFCFNTYLNINIK
jgi:putative Ca2+/H+ antiporter (TMEM165/GDT1 family)